MSQFHWEGDSSAVGKAERASHSSTSRRWESALHFCQSCASGAQQEAVHMHTPLVVAVTPKQGDFLLKRIEYDPESHNKIS